MFVFIYQCVHFYSYLQKCLRHCYARVQNLVSCAQSRPPPLPPWQCCFTTRTMFKVFDNIIDCCIAGIFPLIACTLIGQFGIT